MAYNALITALNIEEGGDASASAAYLQQPLGPFFVGCARATKLNFDPVKDGIGSFDSHDNYSLSLIAKINNNLTMIDCYLADHTSVCGIVYYTGNVFSITPPAGFTLSNTTQMGVKIYFDPTFERQDNGEKVTLARCAVFNNHRYFYYKIIYSPANHLFEAETENQIYDSSITPHISFNANSVYTWGFDSEGGEIVIEKQKNNSDFILYIKTKELISRQTVFDYTHSDSTESIPISMNISNGKMYFIFSKAIAIYDIYNKDLRQLYMKPFRRYNINLHEYDGAIFPTCVTSCEKLSKEQIVTIFADPSPNNSNLIEIFEIQHKVSSDTRYYNVLTDSKEYNIIDTDYSVLPDINENEDYLSFFVVENDISFFTNFDRAITTLNNNKDIFGYDIILNILGHIEAGTNYTTIKTKGTKNLENFNSVVFGGWQLFPGECIIDRNNEDSIINFNNINHLTLKDITFKDQIVNIRESNRCEIGDLKFINTILTNNPTAITIRDTGIVKPFNKFSVQNYYYFINLVNTDIYFNSSLVLNQYGITVPSSTFDTLEPILASGFSKIFAMEAEVYLKDLRVARENGSRAQIISSYNPFVYQTTVEVRPGEITSKEISLQEALPYAYMRNPIIFVSPQSSGMWETSIYASFNKITEKIIIETNSLPTATAGTYDITLLIIATMQQ